MAIVLSVVNNKGGVAKTTTVVNLASALSKYNKKVLVIDLDPQASLTVYLGHDPLKLNRTIYDVLIGKINIKDSIIKTNDDKVDIIAANIELSAGEVQIISKIGREFILKNNINKINDLYDYIIIDNSPSLGILTVNSMIASDYVIAPVDPTFLSLKGLDILNSTIEEVKLLNNKLQLMGVLITMFDSRTSHHNEVLELLKENYPTFSTVVRRSIKFSDACLAYQSVIDYAGESFHGSKAYLEIAKEVIKHE